MVSTVEPNILGLIAEDFREALFLAIPKLERGMGLLFDGFCHLYRRAIFYTSSNYNQCISLKGDDDVWVLEQTLIVPCSHGCFIRYGNYSFSYYFSRRRNYSRPYGYYYPKVVFSGLSDSTVVLFAGMFVVGAALFYTGLEAQKLGKQ